MTNDPLDERRRRRGEFNAQLHPDPAVHDAVAAWLARKYDIEWQAPPKRFEAWLTKVGVPELLVQALCRSLPVETIEDTAVTLFSAESIEQGDPDLLPHGLLQIGSCGNGDLVVLELRSPQRGAVGFIGHDIYWEQDDKDPRAALRYVSASFTSFILGVARDALPTDYWGSFDSINGSPKWTLDFDDEGLDEVADEGEDEDDEDTETTGLLNRLFTWLRRR
jgi:hypothetical protein